MRTFRRASISSRSGLKRRCCINIAARLSCVLVWRATVEISSQKCTLYRTTASAEGFARADRGLSLRERLPGGGGF